MTTQTQTKDYLGCSDIIAVLSRYLEILIDKGVIEEDEYHDYKNHYYYYIEKHFSDINAALWEYLEILDDEGIIEDYADNYNHIDQFFNSWSFRYSGCYISSEHIIERLDEVYYENKPEEYDFEDYDDYVEALEKFENEELDDEELEERHNELCNVIHDFKHNIYSYLELLREDLETNITTFRFEDEKTGATFYIPITSKFFDYYYNATYRYFELEMKQAIYEASREYPFIRYL